jgi:hypothetical protein
MKRTVAGFRRVLSIATATGSIQTTVRLSTAKMMVVLSNRGMNSTTIMPKIKKTK